jgi:hypothetical protein
VAVVNVGNRRRVFVGLYVLTEVLAVGLVDGEDASLKFRAIVGISDAIVAAKLAQNARPAKHVRTLSTALILCMNGFWVSFYLDALHEVSGVIQNQIRTTNALPAERHIAPTPRRPT